VARKPNWVVRSRRVRLMRTCPPVATGPRGRSKPIPPERNAQRHRRVLVGNLPIHQRLGPRSRIGLADRHSPCGNASLIHSRTARGHLRRLADRSGLALGVFVHC
jgi:hypothetical protein